MSASMGSSAGSFRDLAAVQAWLALAPKGTTLAAGELLEILASIASADGCTPVQPSTPAPIASSSSWRERIWTVPAETRLGVQELAEALDRSASWIHHRTGEKAGAARIPHRKLDGSLAFLAGEICTWIRQHEETVVAGRVDRAPLKLSAGSGR